jgi:hypothetical protein
MENILIKACCVRLWSRIQIIFKIVLWYRSLGRSVKKGKPRVCVGWKLGELEIVCQAQCDRNQMVKYCDRRVATEGLSKQLGENIQIKKYLSVGYIIDFMRFIRIFCKKIFPLWKRCLVLRELDTRLFWRYTCIWCRAS